MNHLKFPLAASILEVTTAKQKKMYYTLSGQLELSWENS